MNLCKECKQPNAWALMDDRYAKLCGPCMHKLEAVLVAFRNKYGEIEGVDESAIDLFTPK